jgi:hypothetical protein
VAEGGLAAGDTTGCPAGDGEGSGGWGPRRRAGQRGGGGIQSASRVSVDGCVSAWGVWRKTDQRENGRRKKSCQMLI